MAEDIHIHVHIAGEDVAAHLAAIDAKLNAVLSTEDQEMADLTAIRDAVAANNDATESAITLLNQLADLVEENKTDETALADIAGQIRSKASDLASAVSENTQPSDQPTPEPPDDGTGTTEPPPPPDQPPTDQPPTDQPPSDGTEVTPNPADGTGDAPQ